MFSRSLVRFVPVVEGFLRIPYEMECSSFLLQLLACVPPWGSFSRRIIPAETNRWWPRNSFSKMSL